MARTGQPEQFFIRAYPETKRETLKGSLNQFKKVAQKILTKLLVSLATGAISAISNYVTLSLLMQHPVQYWIDWLVVLYRLWTILRII